MDRRSLIEMMGAAALGGVLVASGALAQQNPIKDQLVGAWTLLLDDGVKPDGTQVPVFGPNITLKSDEFSCVFLRFLPFGDGRQPTAQ
jgi:hypothetical protein